MFPGRHVFSASAALLGCLGVFVWVSACLALGCNEKAVPPGPDAGAHQTSESLTPEQAAKVLAKVGDRTITLGDYVAALEHMDQFDRLRYQSPGRQKELLGEMINVELLAQEARAKGYDKDPQTQEELRGVLRDAMLAQARKGAPTAADIPAVEVKAYFDAHKDEYRDPERRRLSLLVTNTEGEAKAALAQAMKGLTPSQWGELVRAKSVVKDNGPLDLAGDVGLVSPPGDERGSNPKVSPEIREAAFTIPKVSEVADHVVKSAGKYYVVRMTIKEDPKERSMAEADRSIRVKLAQDKLRGREADLLAQLRAKFPVQVDDATLATVKVDLATADGGLPADAGADAR
jgi:DNA-directed RNA polymerase subunit F